MSKNRDTESDKQETRKLILDWNRSPYSAGGNWLGHGIHDGKNAVIDYLLLDGATMEQFLLERSTQASVRSHFQHLRNQHDMPVSKGADGRYRFDRGHLGLPESLAALTESNAEFTFPEEIVEVRGLFEGALRKVTVNAYERDHQARCLCIAHYGPKCVVCGFDFGHVYGPYADGLIHVHHVTPLSQVGREYEVDPVADLRPVCPNCHAVIHRGGLCLSIEEIKEKIHQAQLAATLAPTAAVKEKQQITVIDGTEGQTHTANPTPGKYGKPVDVVTMQAVDEQGRPFGGK